LTLGQSGAKLILRLRSSVSGPKDNGREEGLCALPGEGQNCHVIVTYSPGKLACYLNGKQVLEMDRFDGDFSTWEPHHFVLGDEFTGDRDWHGAIEGIAIYSRALSAREAAENYKAHQAGKTKSPRSSGTPK